MLLLIEFTVTQLTCLEDADVAALSHWVTLQEEVPTLELAGNARPRGKWRLGVASKLQDVIHSTPSSPIRGGGSPSHLSPLSHSHRPRSAAAMLAQPHPAEAKAACVAWEQSCRSPGGEGLTKEGQGVLAGAVDAAPIASQVSVLPVRCLMGFKWLVLCLPCTMHPRCILFPAILST